MVTVAVYPGIVKLFIQTEYIDRIRIAIGFLSLVVLVITFEALRLVKMQERYALLWVTTGTIILIFALLPQIVYMFGRITGMQYVDSIVAVIITFLLLVAFHFSVAMSRFQNHQSALTQQHAILNSRVEVLEKKLGISLPVNYTQKEIYKEVPCPTNEEDVEKLKLTANKEKIVKNACYILIGITVLSVLVIGVATPSPMIGDEVTHFYMLKTQSERLPEPNFIAEIPLGNGGIEARRYPHSFVWHYLGAVILKVFHGKVRTIQIYHLLFLIQFLMFGYLLARTISNDEYTTPLIYILSCISIPMLLIFSVAFYQDVPLTAQIVAACFFLQKRKWFSATLFVCFGVTLKVTGVLFIPAFIIIIFAWGIKQRQWGRLAFRLCLVIMLLFMTMYGMAWSLKQYGDSEYYPVETLKKIAAKLNIYENQQYDKPVEGKSSSHRVGENKVSPYEVQIIANHPGDLRDVKNFIIYGGFVIWIMVLFYIVHFPISIVARLRKVEKNELSAEAESLWWLWLLGGSFISFSYLFLRTAPDARFFLPGLMLIMLPVSKYVAGLQGKKIWLPLLLVVCLLQAGMVLKKVYTLRHVSPEIISAVNFLKTDKHSTKMFMYPEGNYRLFSIPHDWYLDYKLREFWRGNNDYRIKLLNENGIDTIVVKKHLIGRVTKEIVNLGVYPKFFVKDLRQDKRFKKIFENSDVIIFRVPKK